MDASETLNPEEKKRENGYYTSQQKVNSLGFRVWGSQTPNP